MTSVGMAAGIAAAFNAPIAAVTFTLEELIGSLDQTMLTGVIVAAALAAVVENTVLGANPIFHVPKHYQLGNDESLVWYALLGLLAAVVSVVFTDSLLWLRAWFKRLDSVPRWVHPAIGGAATGGLALVAIAFFHVNGIAGDPYQTLTMALTGATGLTVVAMVTLCLLKLAATVTSYSSGGAGGIFAPSLFMGGMLGGAVGYIDVAVFHHPADSIGAFAVVGMGAVFAGVVRAPMTSILIIFEMTGGYGLILPLMIANMSAFALARYWRPPRSTTRYWSRTASFSIPATGRSLRSPESGRCCPGKHLDYRRDENSSKIGGRVLAICDWPNQAASEAESRTPNACMTLSAVPNSGFPASLSAR
jgi:CIC family chloride channel protein